MAGSPGAPGCCSGKTNFIHNGSELPSTTLTRKQKKGACIADHLPFTAFLSPRQYTVVNSYVDGSVRVVVASVRAVIAGGEREAEHHGHDDAEGQPGLDERVHRYVRCGEKHLRIEMRYGV